METPAPHERIQKLLEIAHECIANAIDISNANGVHFTLELPTTEGNNLPKLPKIEYIPVPWQYSQSCSEERMAGWELMPQLIDNGWESSSSEHQC